MNRISELFTCWGSFCPPCGGTETTSSDNETSDDDEDVGVNQHDNTTTTTSDLSARTTSSNFYRIVQVVAISRAPTRLNEIPPTPISALSLNEGQARGEDDTTEANQLGSTGICHGVPPFFARGRTSCTHWRGSQQLNPGRYERTPSERGETVQRLRDDYRELMSTLFEILSLHETSINLQNGGESNHTGNRAVVLL